MADYESRNDAYDNARADEADQTVKLRAEQLQVQKTPVQTGSVYVRKEVVTENQTITVPVRKEKVIIERREVSADEATGYIGEIGEEEYIIPVREEQITVTKTPIVTEEIIIRKIQIQETQQVQDTVRHEELRVDEEFAQ